MKTLHTLFKKQWFLLSSLAFVFFASLFLLFAFKKEERLFRELTTEIFKGELIPNTLNLHYTLAHPSDYGIYQYEPRLPVYSGEDCLLASARLENYLSVLKAISPEKLNTEDHYTYVLLTSYLSNQLSGSKLPYYDEPLSPGSGMQSQLPILLAEYTLRNRRDISDYLSLLSQTDSYLAGLAAYEQEKSAAGLFMSDTSLAKTMEQCHQIITAEALQAGTHFLQTTFSERLAVLASDNIITAKEKTAYEVLNNRLLQTVMQPAYTALADSLNSLRGTGTDTKGLAALPQGKAYYEYLVRQNTGSCRTIEEIKNLLYPQFQKDYTAIQNFAADAGQAALLSENLPDSFPLTDPYEMLTDLQSRMIQDFPAFPATGSQASPSCLVKNVSPSLENYSSPAFYLTPPLDDSSSNVIYINQKSSPTGVDLYTTLAHEGYPGHLYQSVYNQLYTAANHINPIRHILWYGGYLEGWALYVEFLSYDYAADIWKQAGNENAALSCELEKYNRSMQLCLYSLLDIAIHYENATYEQVAKLLASLGITDEKSLRAIYEYIAEEPANYLKYYLGYMEILNLKQQAETLWGNDYTDDRFHRFFLECGPSDFASLSAALAAGAEE